MGVLWKLEPATEAKHRLYKQYLDASANPSANKLTLTLLQDLSK